MRLFPLFAALALAACFEAPRPTADPEEPRATFPYDLSAPSLVLELPPELREISGLTVLPSGRLGAVQDEEGIIYEVDASGAISGRLRFHGKGDFEGLALVPGDAVWVLRSDGDLFHVARDSAGQTVVRTFETRLKKRSDAEGLTYDPAGHRLLVAAKEWPGEDARGDDYEGVRAIYAFDLATETMPERPAVLLDRARLDGRRAFKPSALAVHHTTGRLYVLSSVRRALAEVAPDGSLLGVADLPTGLAPQPEGLAFGPDGTLYISSEGPSGPGTLLRFDPL